MIERLYLRAYVRVARRPRPFLVSLAVALLISLPLLAGVRLDMSFRPLFVDDPAESEATRAFEAVFGQASGAHIGVLIEGDEILGGEFLRNLALVTGAVERIEHVSEVVSLTRLPVPIWSGTAVRGVPVIPPEALDPGAGDRLDALLDRVRSDERIRGTLLSVDGRSTLLLARVALPLEDLDRRGAVIREFRSAVEAGFGDGVALRFVGVSVVEDAYAGIVLNSLARSFVLTTLGLVLVLFLIFRRAAAVAVVMAGVVAAMPLTIAVLTAIGQDLTMVNSMVPVMILIIGVADGIHMLEAFRRRVESGHARAAAVRGMFREMAVPCLLTTVTTILGFLALHAARITAIRDFGVNVAVGVALVYLANLLLVPWLLHRVPVHRVVTPSKPIGRGWTNRAIGVIAVRPGWVALAALVAVAAAAEAAPRLRVDQRFNEEVAPEHPVRADQAALERELTGFLGPDLSLRRAGGTMLDPASAERLRELTAALRSLPDVRRVESVLDLLPPGIVAADVARAVDSLREDPLLGARVDELVSSDGAHAAVTIRTSDIGTARARDLGAGVERLAREHLGPGVEARVVGQWWLAQRGMDGILRDMLASFATSCLLVLPLLALTLRNGRLALVGALPNLLPMLFAIAFMAWTGISLRIGTAMILAIALGIAIDDTVHLLVRLKRETARQPDPAEAVRETLRAVGPPLVYTTAALVVGFLGMLANDLLALRDMGITAAATLTAALAADLAVAPALFLLTSRRRATAAVQAPAPIAAPESIS